MRNLLRYFLMALVLLAVALLSALTAMRLAIHGARMGQAPVLPGRSPAPLQITVCGLVHDRPDAAST